MQEEVENRTVNLAISTTKLTFRTIVNGYNAWKRHHQAKVAQKTSQLPIGKQSIKELIGQNQGVSSIPIEKTDLKGFEQVARKYGVDYAITKDQNVIPPKYTVFFKAKDADLGVPIGSKQGGVRPVVVLQNDVGNFYSPTITVAPLTTKIQKKRSQPTHYFLRKAKGLARSSMVLAEQLDTCDKTCVIRYLGKVSKGQMRGIDEAVKVQLGYYIPEQAEKRRQGKCRKEVNFDGG